MAVRTGPPSLSKYSSASIDSPLSFVGQKFSYNIFIGCEQHWSAGSTGAHVSSAGVRTALGSVRAALLCEGSTVV